MKFWSPFAQCKVDRRRLQRLANMQFWMRSAFVAAMMAYGLSAGSITYASSTVGTNGSGETVYRYVFDLSDVPLQLNQELNIHFPAAEFGSLLNGVAPARDFDLLLFQPNAPFGADGAYSLLALVNQPAMTGLFRVDFTLIRNVFPSALVFAVNQFDANGEFLNTVTPGLTGTPEPSTWVLGTSGLIFAALIKGIQQRR